MTGEAVEARRTLISKGARAIEVLSQMMEDASTPAASRVMACRALVEASGVRDVEDPADKPAHEMTRAELAALAADARQYLAKLEAEGDRPEEGVFE